MASTSRTPPWERRAVPMARFSIEEDEDEDDAPPIVSKHPRCSEPPSQSHIAAEEDEELIPVEFVESDSQGGEEEEDEGFVVDEEDEDDEFVMDEEDGDEEDGSEDDRPELVGKSQQRTSSASASASAEALLPQGLPDVAVVNRSRSTASPVVSNGKEELQAVLTDPDVLDCPICLDPLTTPVFQCENGHIACFSCCSKVNRKCPSCCMPIGYNRCRAIEKVIESVKVSCKNAHYGCTMRMIYNKKNEHEQMCPHALCFCPNPSCPFSGSSKNLYLHFGIHHAASTTRFTYNTTFTLRVERDQKHMLLQEQNESVVFILNHEVKEQGHAFIVDCVGPSSLKSSFAYQLTAKSSEATLSLHCVPEIYAKWSEHTLKRNYLTVPSHFVRCNGVLCFINVLIKKAISPV